MPILLMMVAVELAAFFVAIYLGNLVLAYCALGLGTAALMLLCVFAVARGLARNNYGSD